MDWKILLAYMSFILSLFSLVFSVVSRVKAKKQKRETRFEEFTCCLKSLVDLLEEVYGLDPYTDDSPWADDGYTTCKEWLESKVGHKGTYPWKKQTKSDEATLTDETVNFFNEALLKNIAPVNMLFDRANSFDGKEVEFRSYKPLATVEDDTNEEVKQ